MEEEKISRNEIQKCIIYRLCVGCWGCMQLDVFECIGYAWNVLGGFWVDGWTGSSWVGLAREEWDDGRDWSEDLQYREEE